MRGLALRSPAINRRHVSSDKSEHIQVRVRRWTVLCSIFFVLGFGSAIVGLLVSLEAALGVVTASGDAKLWVTLPIMAAFPLLMLGAHGLDKIAEARRDLRFGELVGANGQEAEN